MMALEIRSYPQSEPPFTTGSLPLTPLPPSTSSDEQPPRAAANRLPSIVELIEMVQRLKESYRPLTQQEQAFLLSFPGWGAYAPAFETQPPPRFQAVGPQLRMLLGPEGYEAASHATPTSFFTDPKLSRGIWQLAERLGFRGGAVLEPGCGTGQIIASAPSQMALHVTGIEQEPLSASIAQLLHPEAHIIPASLQETALADEAFDLVVGNVPFANVAIHDRTLPVKGRLSLHNYCLYRALAALRPGGLALLITSRYTLDAHDPKAREVLARLGVLLGAIRLPSGSHRFAKTEVITDLLVFQHRVNGACWSGHDWIGTADLDIDGGKLPINTYFVNHPQQILGKVSLGRGMHHDEELVIKAPDDLEAALSQAIERIVYDAIRHQSTYLPRLDPRRIDAQLLVVREDGLKEGCFYVLPDAGLVQISAGQPRAVKRMEAEITALVRLRDAALTLVEAERDYTKRDEDLLPLRRELNRRYDAYVTQYGSLHRSTVSRRIDKETGEEHLSRRMHAAMSLFRTDEHAPLVLGLEQYDEESGKGHKTPIFLRRVNHPPVYKETADSREEAIALSLDRYGRLDLAFIATATSRPEDEVPAFLGELAYEDPESQHWEIAPLYLSGNVRHKLDIASRAACRDPARFERNVKALETVQPAPIPPEEITVLLGAPWIPASTLCQFCRETFKLTPDIFHDQLSGSWKVVPPCGMGACPEVTSQWGTRRVHAFRLLEHLLNHKKTVVEDEDKDGKTVVNREETMLAQQKRKAIQTRFSAWVWEDATRTKELAARYNTLYNGVVPTTYTGSHLSFPGMDAYWQEHLYPWQRDFIARMLSTRSALCAYPVGAGKTKIQVAGAMTLRRMKLCSKAAIVVPNHLLEQITSEAKQLYPAASILMLSPKELIPQMRRLFLARIATGDHDLVIMTHSAFQAIDVHPQTRKAYLEERIREYRQVLCRLDPEKADRAEQRHIKEIEKQLARLREQLRALLDTRHDPGITFEQLGISYLIIDEAHLFKNLGLPTNQEQLQVTPSQRAQDLLMKLRWLEQHNGTRPFASFFTATPISNSMVEAYVMLWYLNQHHLRERDLFTIDDFASLFIETEAKIEVTPNGAGFRLHERPRNFVNLPEFLHLFTSVADIRPPDILAEQRPQRLEHTIAVEPTEEVMAYVNTLVFRSERLHHGTPSLIDGKLDNMLWVTTDGRKAALWLGLHGIAEPYPVKLDAITTQMATIYHRWQKQATYLPGLHKSLQVGFCDMGTPNAEKGEQVYGELKRLLVEKGIPARGIRYIHEAESDAAKAALFEQCRKGEVAILLGSTAKLGTGTNIQIRLCAIHHCDAPWRPDEVEQREGRGLRPGNLYPVVEIFYYVQRRTFDAYSWQILSNKARFFNQIRSATVTSRQMAYSDDSELTYGQVKAAASGDVLLLEHANVCLAVEGFSSLHASFERARQRDRQEADLLRHQALEIQHELKRLEQIAQATRAATSEQSFLTKERVPLTAKAARREYLAKQVQEAVQQQAPVRKLGYRLGVPLFLVSNPLSMPPYLLMVGDPHTGWELPIVPRWLEAEQSWRLDERCEQFFEQLATHIEEQKARITSISKQAEEFERQAQTPFGEQQNWQKALARKKELDHYIEVAARARSREDLQRLSKLREHLLATMPKELLDERPRASNTARFVLPPRNPNTPNGSAETQTSRIEVGEETTAAEPTIEQVARTIQQSVVGSKATLVFGNLEHIQQRKKARKKKGTRGSAPPSAAKQNGEVKTAPTMRTAPSPTLWDQEQPEEALSSALPPSSDQPHTQMSLW